MPPRVAAAHPPTSIASEPICSGLVMLPGSGLGSPLGAIPPALEGDGPSDELVPALAIGDAGFALPDGDGNPVSDGMLVGVGVGTGVGTGVGFGVGFGVGTGVGGGGGRLTLTERGVTAVKVTVFWPLPIPLLAANE